MILSRKLLLAITGIFLSVTAFSQVDINSKRISSGKLSNEQIDFVKKFLSPYTSELQDTIVIKYDFNKDDCWELLDAQNKRYIREVLASHNKYITGYEQAHPSISVFELREEGNKFSMLKQWDQHIKIDSGGTFLNKIIKKEAKCGSSIMIFPSGEYIFIKGDSHFETLYLTKEQMTIILGRQ